MTEREQQRIVNHRLAVLQHVDGVTGNVAQTCRALQHDRGLGHLIRVIVFSSILEGAVFGPATMKMLDDEGATKLPSVFRWGLPVYIVLFGFTIWAMVTKLGG